MEGEGAEEMVQIPANEGVERLLDELIRKMDQDDIKDCFQDYLEYCDGDVIKMLITFLKILLATLPESSIHCILTAQDVHLRLGYNVEELQKDLKELNGIFHVDQQKRLKMYSKNFKSFMNEMLSSENWTTILKENRHVLTGLNTMMRIMCTSHYIRVIEVGSVAILEMLHWMLENEVEANEMDPSMGLVEDDSTHMDVDDIGTYLSSNKARTLQCISESLIKNSFTIRLEILKFIRANYKNHFDIVKHDGVLKGLAASIMMGPSSVQLNCVQLLLEILESGFNDQELINWFFETCQISKPCLAVPINLLIENLIPDASIEIINISMKIIIHLEKHYPEGLHEKATGFVFSSLCTKSKDVCKLIGELQHAVLCRLSGSSEHTGFHRYAKYMSEFVKFHQDLARTVPIDLIVNPFLAVPDSPLLNFDYFMRYLLRFERSEAERHDLLKVLKSILRQLKGAVQYENEDLKKVIIISDASADERKTYITNFVFIFFKFIDYVLLNEDFKSQCLMHCLDIIINIPLVFLYKDTFLTVLHNTIESVLFEYSYGYEARRRVIALMAYLDGAEHKNFKDIIKEMIRTLIRSFEENISRLHQEDEDAIQEDTLRRCITSSCQNLLILSDHFDIRPILNELNGLKLALLLSDVLLFEGNAVKQKIHVLKVRHSFLLIDIHKRFDSYKKIIDGEDAYKTPYKTHGFKKAAHFSIDSMVAVLPVMISSLKQLEDPEQIEIFDMICKELYLLHSLIELHSLSMSPDYIDVRVFHPFHQWLQSGIPIVEIVKTGPSVGGFHPEKAEMVTEKVFTLLEEKCLPFNIFGDFLAYGLYKNHPAAVKIVTKEINNDQTVSSILLMLLKLYLREVRSNVLKLMIKRKSAPELGSECMKMVQNIILTIMQENYDTARLVAQNTLFDFARLVIQWGTEIVPESTLSAFIIPWFRIIIEHCLPPTIYSYKDIKNWKSLANAYPRIAAVITKLCKRTDENMMQLEANVRELIFEPEKYISQAANYAD